MTFRVVDTNVAVIANKTISPQANKACANTCNDMLLEIKENGGVILDDRMRILEEYQRYLNFSGQPGTGDLFFQWLWNNQANESQCLRVHITEDASREFLEFPNDARLMSFHKSDRKFVAVALASQQNPEVLIAGDIGWWKHRQTLTECGVQLSFLCPDQFTESK